MIFSDGKGTMETISINVTATDSTGDIAYKLAAAINVTGKFSAFPDGDQLLIKVKPNGRAWTKLDYGTYLNVGGIEVWTPATGPKLKGKQGVHIPPTGQIAIP